jgi:hypothetical protein
MSNEAANFVASFFLAMGLTYRAAPFFADFKKKGRG